MKSPLKRLIDGNWEFLVVVALGLFLVVGTGCAVLQKMHHPCIRQEMQYNYITDTVKDGKGNVMYHHHWGWEKRCVERKP